MQNKCARNKQEKGAVSQRHSPFLDSVTTSKFRL